MTSADVRMFENEILGAGEKAEKAEMGLNIATDLLRTAGGAAGMVSAQQKAKAEEEARKKAGLQPVMTQPQPSGPNFFTKMAGPIPVWGWFLVGAGGLTAIGILAAMMKKK